MSHVKWKIWSPSQHPNSISLAWQGYTVYIEYSQPSIQTLIKIQTCIHPYNVWSAVSHGLLYVYTTIYYIGSICNCMDLLVISHGVASSQHIAQSQARLKPPLGYWSCCQNKPLGSICMDRSQHTAQPESTSWLGLLGMLSKQTAQNHGNPMESNTVVYKRKGVSISYLFGRHQNRRKNIYIQSVYSLV